MFSILIDYISIETPRLHAIDMEEIGRTVTWHHLQDLKYGSSLWKQCYSYLPILH